MTKEVKKNTIYKELDNFNIKIEILPNIDHLLFQLEIKSKENNNDITICFPTLEDTVNFINNIVKAKKSLKEIIIAYRDEFLHGELNIPNPIQINGNHASLTSEEVLQLIAHHFGAHKNYKVDATSELSIDSSQPRINFYLIEHLDYDDIKRDNKTLLTKGDLVNVFNHYLEYLGYELVDFKYLGGIHHTGYFVDEDTPHYEGIELYVREKELGMKFKSGQ